jgi:hypothetical protein
MTATALYLTLCLSSTGTPACGEAAIVPGEVRGEPYSGIAECLAEEKHDLRKWFRSAREALGITEFQGDGYAITGVRCGALAPEG